MAVICRRQRLLFLLNPRTGGTAIADSLIRDAGGEQIPVEDIKHADGSLALQAKHNTLQDLLKFGVLSDPDLRALTVVTAVRNPYDSLYSLYLKLRDRYPSWLNEGRGWIMSNPAIIANIRYCERHSFNEWIGHEYRRAALSTVVGRRSSSMHDRYTAGADVVMRFETLSSDLASLASDFELGPGGIDLRHSNRTTGRSSSYRDAYNRRSRFLVTMAYRDDLQRFGYEF